ncbi:MAG: FHA domain-containing protein [Eubacteriales bacterium]|nr:FHA domain-containing protein [Eubacteriales bacterium]
MRGKELFNVLLLCCCLLILSGSFLPYISVNFPDTNAGWGARSVIQEQLPEMFDENGTFEATAVEMISSMQTENKGGVVKWWFIVVLFLNLVCVLSLLMENKVKYVLIMLLDVLQVCLWFGGVFLALPYGLVRLSGITVTAYTGQNFLGLIRNQEMAELIRVLAKGMRIGYWMPYLFAFVSFILCIVALVTKPKPRYEEERHPRREPRRPEELAEQAQAWNGIPVPGITCVEGPYAGSHAPMEYDEEAIVGNDEEACSLVILSDRISPVHCRVRFDKNRNEYQVMSVSLDGTFVNGYRMEENQWLPLQRGACLKLGMDENILRLD